VIETEKDNKGCKGKEEEVSFCGWNFFKNVQEFVL